MMTGIEFQVVLHGEIEIGDRLCLHSLGSIDEEKNPLAGGKGTGNLVREINVPRRIDQVEDVILAVLGMIRKRDRLALDGDPRSRSMSMLSRIWSLKSRGLTTPVYWIRRSARVDFP